MSLPYQPDISLPSSRSGDNEDKVLADQARYRAAYRRAHSRLRAQRGPASNYSCYHCEAKATQWARLWRINDDVSDLTTYVPMCKDHHKEYDKEIYQSNASTAKPWSRGQRQGYPPGWYPCGPHCECDCHGKKVS